MTTLFTINTQVVAPPTQQPTFVYVNNDPIDVWDYCVPVFSIVFGITVRPDKYVTTLVLNTANTSSTDTWSKTNVFVSNINDASSNSSLVEV